MSQEYLDFELPIAELEAKIEAPRSASDDKIDLHDEIKRLQKKSDELTKKPLQILMHGRFLVWHATQIVHTLLIISNIFLLISKNLQAIVPLQMIKQS